MYRREYCVDGTELAQIPLLRVGSKDILATSAYLNDKDGRWNVDIKRWNTGNTYLIVHTSLPRIKDGGSNCNVLSRDGAIAAVSQLESELANKGIMLDIKKASLSRVDVARDVILEHPLPCYLPIFRMMRMRRGAPREYGEDGNYLLKDKGTTQFSIYDKRKEQLSKGYVIDNIPEHLTRIEMRMFKNKNIKAKLGIERVEQLLSHYDNLDVISSHKIGKVMFRYDTATLEGMMVQNIAEELKAFRMANNGSRWLGSYARLAGYDELHKYGVGVLREALEGMNLERTRIWRFIRKVEDVHNSLLLMRGNKSEGIPLAELYRELRDKILL
jgi:hypothetical protein